MGRCYNGDIEGKFWFGLQSSEAPLRFGGFMDLSFSFSEYDIRSVREELKKIEANTNLDKIKKFFEKNDGWNEEMLAKANITQDELSEYADHELGSKILACLKENEECYFVGEV